MIQANELRLGNLVQYKNRVYNVWNITRSIIELDSESADYHTLQRIDLVEPLPLTEDWLLKFGCISNPYKDRYELLTPRFEYIYIECNQQLTPNLWIEKYPHIKHVHQLQNLYFALTGQELELKSEAV